MPDFYGPAPAPLAAGDYIGPRTAAEMGTQSRDYGSLTTAGNILAMAGALNGAIGAFYSARNQKAQLRSQALSADFARSMANLAARAAEVEAQSILAAGELEAGQKTLEWGQAIGTQRASTAAAGIRGGVGSAAEVEASMKWAKEVDVLTIRRNTAQRAGASRMAGVNAQNEAAMAGVSAANLRATAGTISPNMAARTSLLGSAGIVARQWAQDSREVRGSRSRR